ncbi:MAG: hypothetical protein EOP00_09610 [Pedobacter sp.]|nr:MAG: hypothetical protein EOP00_09610 [Pedobacter sp.]
MKSFISKDPKLRKKIQLLNAGIRQIEARLDIFSLFKKLDELDKLKRLLLEDHQLALFEGLPPPILSLPEDEANKKNRASVLLTRDPKFVLGKRNVDLIIKHYGYLKQKGENRDHVDNKLLSAYMKDDDNL